MAFNPASSATVYEVGEHQARTHIITISRAERVAPEGGPLLACCNVGLRVAQFTFTWMLFGFASGFFGRWMRSTPCFDSARIFSESMVAGSEKARVNVP